MSDADILARLNITESHPEGLFFPDTYLLARARAISRSCGAATARWRAT